MKSLLVIGLLASATISTAYADSFTDYARVRSAIPQYDNVNSPRIECKSEVIRESRRVQASGDERSRDWGGAVIGGIAGGILGNQVGGGRGKDAATAVGAVVGAISGDHLANGRDRGPDRYVEVPREVERCRTIDTWQQRITGYQVTYEYRGQTYSTFMQRQPGSQMRVRVSVEPD